VRGGATQRFTIHVFSYRGFHQIRAGKKDASGLVNDHRFITHDRQVSASCDTTSHDGRDLCDAHRTHDRIVAKDSSEVFFVGKNFILQGKKNSCAVD
jgi:hypothetical protein